MNSVRPVGGILANAGGLEIALGGLHDHLRDNPFIVWQRM
jgi:hypothetical protein